MNTKEGTLENAPAPGSSAEPDGSQCTRARAVHGWRKNAGPGAGVRLRVGLILGLVLAAYCGLGFRLVRIQVTQGAAWKARFDNQKVARELMPAQRGPITDSQNLPLAFCMPRETVIADLKLLRDREAAAEKLAPLLKVPAEQLKGKISRDDRRVVYLARDVEEELAEKIRALKISGIGFEDSFRRTYPQGSLACHLLGWAGVDGGMEGLELELNSLLAGTPGYLRYYRDAARRLIALNDGATGPADARPPRDGLDVILTLDARIQQTAEEELTRIHEAFQPKSTTCIVMDAGTGAILAMACTPLFDPNAPAKSPAENRRNRPATDMYEPGSTFKTFAASMSLERKLWRRNEMIDCKNGAWNLGYRTLHDAHAYGLLSFDEVIIKSSNIGAAQIAARLGVGGLYDTVRLFGFGEKTGLNLPGEEEGRVRPRRSWTADSVSSVAIGHEIAVTPLQLITAYAAVVNGGILYRPKIVQRILNDKGEELYTLHPQPMRRVISEQTSRQMREILTRVVMPGGTGFKAFSAEWSIGGKTGTTRKIDPLTKTYSTTLYIGSFLGFAPADNPRLLCLVTVDEPHKGAGYYGGTVACPAVREVLRKGLTVLNVPPRSADEQKRVISEVKQLAAH